MNNTKYITSDDAIKKVEGKLLGLVEALGLEEKRESAVKAMIRQDLWSLGKVFFLETKFEELRGGMTTYHPAEEIMSNEELGQ